VPLVDSLRIVADAKTKVEHDLEARLDLAAAHAAAAVPAASAPMTTVVFRVAHGEFPVPAAMSIVGADARLGNLTPNTVLMHDDGENGDQRAGDGVWSYTTSLPAGTRLSYVYTNSGARGRWEGLDVPSIRHVTIPPAPDGRAVLLPIETFGHLYLQADNWHTDRDGYDLIAKAVAESLRTEDCGMRIDCGFNQK
jgi:hypothetical protein